MIAQATLKGAIFYNSYSSMLPGGDEHRARPARAWSADSVLRIPPGGTAERFTATNATVVTRCLANGSRLLSSGSGDGALSFALDPDDAAESAEHGRRSARRIRRAVSGRLVLSRHVCGDRCRALVADAGVRRAGRATLYQTDTGMVVAEHRHPDRRPDADVLARRQPAHVQRQCGGRRARHRRHVLRRHDQDREQLQACCSWTPTCVRAGRSSCRTTTRVVFTRTNGIDFSGEGAGLGDLGRRPMSPARPSLRTATCTSPI